MVYSDDRGFLHIPLQQLNRKAPPIHSGGKTL